MKQVLICLGVLLLAMVGYYWTTNRFPANKETKPEIVDKEIYFEAPEKMMAGTETEIKLMARHESGKIVKFSVDFTYDPTVMKIENVEINKDIFDKVAETKIDEFIGKVSLTGENAKNRDSLTSGETFLATIKIKGLKKSGSMVYLSKRPEVEILDGGKVSDGDFQMPNFKVNFL